MPRTINQHEYQTKYNEILDVVQRLMYTKGFAQITIQEILDELGISKGAFYHYFDSKQALLEAVCERMINMVEQMTRPILDDAELSALEKYDRFFGAVTNWKTDNKAFVLALVQVWLNDDNAVVRSRVNDKMRERIAPLFSAIVHQGIEEGVFDTAYPDHAGDVMLSLLIGAQMNISHALLMARTSDDPEEQIRSLVNTYEVHMDAMERAISAPHKTLFRMSEELARIWVNAVREHSA